MEVSASTLRLHIGYSNWANGRLMEAVANLHSEDLDRDFGPAHKSVLGTLCHVFASEGVWLARIEGMPAPASQTECAIGTLQSDWPPLAQRWAQWAERLTDETAGTPLDYADSRGNPWRQPIWQIVLHVVNHSTHHRGQVSGFLRALGRVPPPLDLIFFYRSLQARHAERGEVETLCCRYSAEHVHNQCAQKLTPVVIPCTI